MLMYEYFVTDITLLRKICRNFDYLFRFQLSLNRLLKTRLETLHRRFIYAYLFPSHFYCPFRLNKIKFQDV